MISAQDAKVVLDQNKRIEAQMGAEGVNWRCIANPAGLWLRVWMRKSFNLTPPSFRTKNHLLSFFLTSLIYRHIMYLEKTIWRTPDSEVQVLDAPSSN